MTDEIQSAESSGVAITPAPVAQATGTSVPAGAFSPRGNSRFPQGGWRGGADRRHGGGGRKGGGGREDRVKPEFDQKMLLVRRVARVIAGGRRFSFSVALVIGNRKGQVGVGLGKAGDTALAIDKATRHARKNMITVPLTKTRSIPHLVEVKYSSAQIIMMPSRNKGLIAGSAVRSVLELGGVTDVNAKILSGSKNKLNIARATIKALASLALKSEARNPKSEATPSV